VTNTQERLCIYWEKLSIPLMMAEYLAHAWYHIDWAFHLHLDTHSDYNSPQSGQYVNRTINDPAPEKHNKCLTFCRTLQWRIVKTSLPASVQQEKKVYSNRVYIYFMNALPAILYIQLILLQLYYGYKPPVIKLIILLIQTFFFVFHCQRNCFK